MGKEIDVLVFKLGQLEEESKEATETLQKENVF